LYGALDAQRQARGLSWRQAVLEMSEPFVRGRSRPLSPSTVVSTRTKAVAEGDGVLQMLRWLNRTPESFIPGHPQAADEEVALPAVGPHQVLRFDTRKLHAALDAQRQVRGMTWRQVADDIVGVAESSLTHLAKGGRTGFPHVARLAGWLGRPVADFTRITFR
jgi:hypothetical protein